MSRQGGRIELKFPMWQKHILNSTCKCVTVCLWQWDRHWISVQMCTLLLPCYHGKLFSTPSLSVKQAQPYLPTEFCEANSTQVNFSSPNNARFFNIFCSTHTQHFGILSWKMKCHLTSSPLLWIIPSSGDNINTSHFKQFSSLTASMLNQPVEVFIRIFACEHNSPHSSTLSESQNYASPLSHFMCTLHMSTLRGKNLIEWLIKWMIYIGTFYDEVGIRLDELNLKYKSLEIMDQMLSMISVNLCVLNLWPKTARDPGTCFIKENEKHHWINLTYGQHTLITIFYLVCIRLASRSSRLQIQWNRQTDMQHSVCHKTRLYACFSHFLMAIGFNCLIVVFERLNTFPALGHLDSLLK